MMEQNVRMVMLNCPAKKTMRLHPGRLVRGGAAVVLIFLIVLYWLRYKLGIDLEGLSRQRPPVWLEENSRDIFNLHHDPASQEEVDYIAKYLQVNFNVLDNFEDDRLYQAELKLTNTGSQPIRGTAWEVYLYLMSHVEPGRMRNKSVEIGSMTLRLSHINGGLFYFTPGSHYTTLLPMKALVAIFHIKSASVAKTDFAPNWYVSGQGLEPRVLLSTQGEGLNFIGPYNHPAKWKRQKADAYNPFTPSYRYEINQVDSAGKPEIPVLPTPVHLSYTHTDPVKVDSTWVVVASTGVTDEANYLSKRLGLQVTGDVRGTRFIQLTLDEVTLKDARLANSTERYSVEVKGGAEPYVTISGVTAVGVFYGIQTFLSLLAGTLRPLFLVDAPRFPYRGLMLDVSRNFHPKEDVLLLLDAMAMYKLNTLHLHLSDDDGWRLEIPGLPELTKLGSRRCHDLSESVCLIPALGSGPTTGSTGSGYYSREAYRSILRHAAQLHINIIPELDMPAHMRAAIKSMELRHKRLMQAGKVREAKEFLLSDPDDRSVYASPQMYIDGALNCCMESSFTFVSFVMTALAEMHRGVLPLKTFHFGGDEIPSTALIDSPICQQLLRDNPRFRDIADVKENFVRRVAAMAAKLGANIQGWEDGYLHLRNIPYDISSFPKGQTLYSNNWLARFEDGSAHRIYQMANLGFKVIATSATHLYLDHPHEPDPEERGLYWATRYISLKKMFGFMPMNFYENMDTTLYGQPLSHEEMCGAIIDCPSLLQPQNIHGMEAALWTETVRTREQLHGMIFPRLFALAERSWHHATWEDITDQHTRSRLLMEDWSHFVDSIGFRELKRLEQMGIMYYLPPPGAKLVDGELRVNTAIPGLVIQYSDDNGQTWHDLSTGVRLLGNVLLASRSYDGHRRSRSISIKLTG